MAQTQVGTAQVKDATILEADLALATRQSLRELSRKSLRQWLKNPVQTAYVNVGMIAAPTVTTSTAASSGDATAKTLLITDTAATTNSFCEVISATFNYCRRAFFPDLIIPFRTQASISVLRIWAGFCSGSLTLVGAPTTQSVAAFRYDTVQDGTAFWRCITCDAASGVTTTVTTVAVVIATEYLFRIEMNPTDVRFYIDDVLVGTHTTDMPGVNTSVGITASVTTLENVLKSMRTGSFVLLHT